MNEHTASLGVAVVTGASSGIGEATARRLARAGFHVVAAARRVERLEALASEIGCTPMVLDVTNDESVASFSEALVTEFGERGLPVTLLVNNAGGALGQDPVDTGSVEQWRAMYEVNVLGTLRVTQAVLPLLRAAEAAQIVVVSSTAAMVTYEGGGGYTAAKHGEGALVRTLRLELAGEPIRVAEIAPGMVATEEFSLVRFGGDRAAADKVYADVDRPLTADDVARCIEWVGCAPAHLNIDLMVVRPLAQAAQHKVFRGKLFSG